jgi:DNA-binding MarR family transcriptional regulator
MPTQTARRRRTTATGDLERIEQALGDLVRLTSSAKLHATRVRGSGVQISRTHLRFLTQVQELGPVSVSKLAARMDLSQPTASRALQQLEADGLVERSGDPSDGRIAHYSITPAGLDARGRMHTFMTQQLAEALQGLEPDRRRQTADVLTDLVARLSASPT